MRSKKPIIAINIIIIITAIAIGMIIRYRDAIFGMPEFGGPEIIVPHYQSKIARYNRELIKLNGQYRMSSGEEREKLLNNMLELAKTRKTEMLQLIETEPKQFLHDRLTWQTRLAFPGSIQNIFEHELSATGTLTAFNLDDKENKKTSYQYFLKDGQNDIRLYFSADQPAALSGTVIQVNGIGLDNNMVMSALDANNYKEITKAKVKVKTKKVAVILFNFQDDQRRFITRSKVRKVTFTGKNSVNKFWRENAYGRVKIRGKNNPNGDIYGWVSIPYSSQDCHFKKWYKSADKKIKESLIDLRGYTNRVYVFPHSSACEWSGMGSLGGKSGIVLINGNNYDLTTVAHELGHNFGFDHAGARECYDQANKQVAIGTQCYDDEYGDVFDIMGMESTYHTNGFNKLRAGWLKSKNIRVGTNGKKYHIYPIEKASNQVQLLQIPRLRNSAGIVTNYYNIEYRRPYGFDKFKPKSAAVNGVIIRISGRTDRITPTFLLDSRPATPTLKDASLVVHKTFYDPLTAISIIVNRLTKYYAEVQIGTGKTPCVRTTPAINLSSDYDGALEPGEALNYTVLVTDNDSSTCPMMSFKFSSTVPQGWTAKITPVAVVNLGPGDKYEFTVRVVSASDAAPGSYPISFIVTNGADSNFVSNASQTINVIINF